MVTYVLQAKAQMEKKKRVPEEKKKSSTVWGGAVHRVRQADELAWHGMEQQMTRLHLPGQGTDPGGRCP